MRPCVLLAVAVAAVGWEDLVLFTKSSSCIFSKLVAPLTLPKPVSDLILDYHIPLKSCYITKSI